MSDEKIVGVSILDLPGFVEPHVTSIVETADGRLEREVVGGEYRCDFCLELLPRWEVPCEDFVFPNGTDGSTGPWGACDACAGLILVGDREALLDRTLIPAIGRPRAELARVRRDIAGVHELFWKHKTGDPEPWKEG